MEHHETAYLGTFDSLISDSYSELDTSPTALDECRTATLLTNPDQLPELVVQSTSAHSSFVSASSLSNQCGQHSVCVVPPNVTVLMDGNINVAAMIIRGKLLWTSRTQQTSEQHLCAGYVAVEENGNFTLRLNDQDGANKRAWVYIKDNGASHRFMKTRSFGAVGLGGATPTIDLEGRPLRRTWSLLAETLEPWATEMRLMHDPVAMGWRVGDRIQVGPTKGGSEGEAQSFVIAKFAPFNRVVLTSWAWDEFRSDTQFVPTVGAGNRKPLASLRAAEVIHLTRNVIVTGDDFRHIDCDPTLEVVEFEMSNRGCHCRPGVRSKCTMGLHTIHMFSGGISKYKHIRVEKCGQRGILGKYCMHFHLTGDSPNFELVGNAIEYSQQRAINIHGTHRSKIEFNVMTDVRGSAMYVQDGNEMYNRFLYNVAICPWRLNDPYKRGCTIPGSPNGQADTALNQVGIWLSGAVNDLIGNRMSNSFNGMLVDVGHAPTGVGASKGLVCTAGERLGRWEGNTFHSHGRFGTYGLGNLFPKKSVGESMLVENDGHYATSAERNDICNNGAAQFTQGGGDNGWSHAIKSNFDWHNTFVGHYGAGDIQYMEHTSYANNNLIYWKTSKSFADGCSALFKDSYYSRGNMALPDEGTFLFENVVMDGPVSLEANHHCDVGSTGVLCQPHYVMTNVKRIHNTNNAWISFQGGNNENATNFGGIFTMSPPECSENLLRNSSQAKDADSFIEGGFCSVVSGRYTYLSALPVCSRTEQLSNALKKRYASGILCKGPLRALKIFSHSLPEGYDEQKLRVEIFLNAKTIDEQNQQQVADAEMFIPFHKVSNKQGFSVPVLPINHDSGMETHSYRISLGSDLSPVPDDWIITFSDPAFGHRWEEETIIMNVVGRTCGENGNLLVSSQHDRKYLVSDDGGLVAAVQPNGPGRGRGACTLHPRMVDIDCGHVPSLSATNCPAKCEDGCNDASSYCDCGTAQCECLPGYSGSACEIDLCGAARCS